MKKLLSVIMITMLCLSVGACGGSGSSAGSDAAGSKAETGTESIEGSSASVSESTAAETTDSEEAAKKAEEQRKLLEAFGGSKEFPTSIAFETEDFDGNTVTEAVFADADVTLVHVWATYCAPCIKEMENLGKMAESLPDNAQVIGICADVNSLDAPEMENAKQILADNNIKFTNLVVNDSFSGLLSNIVGVPTTFIVDPEGNVVDEPIVGSNVVGYKRMAKDYLKTLE